MSKRVLIVGGYGVFGGRLAAALAKDPGCVPIVAGRSLAKAETFCTAHGGEPLGLDLGNPDLAAIIKAVSPDIIVDAAGPFQTYDDDAYKLAAIAIDCGAHYLDLSDDAGFTAGITALTSRAEAAGVTILSGMSSVPALSSAVAGALTEDMADIHSIDTAILLGNKSPRGLSVVRAATAQAGRPLRIWRNNQWTEVKAWSDARRITLTIPGEPPLSRRRASHAGAPDLTLFPGHFKARSVSFRAGLELRLMQDGLAILSLPVRWGLVKSLSPLSRLLKWASDRLAWLGTDRGGMIVVVTGETTQGACMRRDWSLIVKNGDGPSVPAIPALILCRKLAAGALAPGARPALCAFSLAEAEDVLSEFSTHTHRAEKPITPLFRSALGDTYDALPPALRTLHTVLNQRRWTGRARILRGKSILARLVGWFAGFPPASEDTAVEVAMSRTAKGETWTRTFGTHRFSSYLSHKGPAGSGRMRERFGPLSFTIALEVKNSALHFPITKGNCLGLPLPRFLLPKSETTERVDAQGRATFDVAISLPIAGHVVGYKGWLEDTKN